MNINDFITPSLLRAIHPEDLKQILSPLERKMTRQSLWYDDETKSFPINKLVQYLRETSLPRNVEDAFFIISSLVKINSEDVLIALIDKGLDINGDIVKQASTLWFEDSNLCKEILAKEEIKKPRKYNYYKPIMPIAPVSNIAQDRLEIVKEDLSDWFARQSKSSYLMLLQNEDEEDIFISIFHGSNKKRKTTVDSSGSDVITFRDEIADIVRINKKLGTIGICLRYRSSSMEAHYLSVFGNIFAPNVAYIRESRFSLSPLYNIERALSIGTLSNKVFNFRLKEMVCYLDGQRLTLSGKNATSIWNKLPISSVVFKSAKFGVLFTNDSAEKEISITPPFGIEYPERCGHDEIIDQLLRTNGFIVENTEVEESDNVEETLLVGN